MVQDGSSLKSLDGQQDHRHHHHPETPYSIEQLLIFAGGFGRFQKKILAIAALSFLACGTNMLMPEILKPRILDAFPISELQADLIGSAFFLGYTIGLPLWGILSDTCGRRPITLLACLLMCVFGSGVFAVPHFASICVFRLLSGFGTCGVFNGVLVLVMEYVGSDKRALCKAIFACFWSGSLISLAFFGWLLSEVNWQYLVVLQIPAFAAMVVMIFHLPESVHYFVATDEPSSAMRLISDVAGVNDSPLPFNEYRAIENPRNYLKMPETPDHTPSLLATTPSTLVSDLTPNLRAAAGVVSAKKKTARTPLLDENLADMYNAEPEDAFAPESILREHQRQRVVNKQMQSRNDMVLPGTNASVSTEKPPLIPSVPQMRKLSLSLKPDIEQEDLPGDVASTSAAWSTVMSLFEGETRTVTTVVCWSHFAITLCYYGVAFQTSLVAGGNLYVSVALGAAVEIPGHIAMFVCANTFGRRRAESAFAFLVAISCFLLSLPVSYGPLLDSAIALIARMSALAGANLLYVIAAEGFPSQCRSFGMNCGAMAGHIGALLGPVFMDTTPNAVLALSALSTSVALSAFSLKETLGVDLK
mmetsp:Transcript_7306/g.13186  ORF Transcript_7306/g.13186 Transcript_7306/m.13186 type:complete len:589 (-) Transcript_7306:48-1814(-)